VSALAILHPSRSQLIEHFDQGARCNDSQRSWDCPQVTEGKRSELSWAVMIKGTNSGWGFPY
jgi:hypothetical protein